MTIRFFILQAHYRSTVDFSNEALIASEKGLQRLIEAIDGLGKVTPASATSEGINVKELRAKCYAAMNDDLNTPIAVSYTHISFIKFKLSRHISAFYRD